MYRAGVGLATTLRMDSWEHPGVFEEASFVSHNPLGYPFPRSEWGAPQGPTGCASVRFDPAISAQPTSTVADSPTGLSIDLTVPQEALSNPAAIAQADLRKAVVTLPEGLTVNPSSADGLAACSLAQIDLDGENTEPACPAASKFGSVTVDTPLLDEPLQGSVYLAAQGDNPFRSLLAMYIVAKGPGVVLKLAGRIEADPVTGRLTTTFDDNPQLPFSKLSLSLKTGPRAPLATPTSCGSKAFAADLGSWAGQSVSETDSFTIDCPAGGGFAPAFRAGAVNPKAGAFSPFVVQIERPDRQENIDGLTVELPAGSLAKLKGIPLCPDAAAAAGTCAKGSRVGSATVAAGAGPNPFSLKDQPVYLGGPYKGAPFSLSRRARRRPGRSISARSWCVRRCASIRSTRTRPWSPIRCRRSSRASRCGCGRSNVDIDRPGFMLNPTSCATEGDRRDAAARSTAQTADGLDRFQVGDCAALELEARASG